MRGALPCAWFRESRAENHVCWPNCRRYEALLVEQVAVRTCLMRGAASTSSFTTSRPPLIVRSSYLGIWEAG